MSIGDEPVFVPVFGDELDEPQSVFDTLERDHLVNNDSVGFLVAALLEVFDQGVVFESGNEDDSVAPQRLIPSVVGLTSIKDREGTSRQLQCSDPVDFVLLALGHVNEFGPVAIRRDADVKLDGFFF